VLGVVTGQVGKLCRKEFKKGSEANLSGRVAKEANLEEPPINLGHRAFIDLDDPRRSMSIEKRHGDLSYNWIYSDMLVQSKTTDRCGKAKRCTSYCAPGRILRGEHDCYTTVFRLASDDRSNIFATAALHGECTSQYVYAEFAIGMDGQKVVWYSVYTSKPLGFSALEDVAEAAARHSQWKGRKNTVERTIGFQRTYLIRRQVAETLTAAPVISSQQQL